MIDATYCQKSDDVRLNERMWGFISTTEYRIHAQSALQSGHCKAASGCVNTICKDPSDGANRDPHKRPIHQESAQMIHAGSNPP